MHHARPLSALSTISILAFTLLSGLASAQSSLSGSFGFLLSASYPDPSSNSGLALLGIMNFDGAGNVTGSALAVAGATPGQAAQNTPSMLTGTYSTSPDNTGSIILNLAPGETVTLAAVITDGGQGIQLAATNCTFPCGRTLLSGVARVAYAGALQGTYGFQLYNSPQSAGAFLGVIGFDGSGNATASSTITSDGGSSGEPSVAKGSLTGTYSSNPDGTGTITYPVQPGLAAALSEAFVITDGGSGILLLMTNFPAGVPFGSGRLQ